MEEIDQIISDLYMNVQYQYGLRFLCRKFSKNNPKQSKQLDKYLFDRLSPQLYKHLLGELYELKPKVAQYLLNSKNATTFFSINISNKFRRIIFDRYKNNIDLTLLEVIEAIRENANMIWWHQDKDISNDISNDINEYINFFSQKLRNKGIVYDILGVDIKHPLIHRQWLNMDEVNVIYSNRPQFFQAIDQLKIFDEKGIVDIIINYL